MTVHGQLHLGEQLRRVGHRQLNRAAGPYWYLYWGLIFCNVLAPQVLWVKRVRTNPPALFVVALIVLVGMWLERYVIVVTFPPSHGAFHV